MKRVILGAVALLLFGSMAFGAYTPEQTQEIDVAIQTGDYSHISNDTIGGLLRVARGGGRGNRGDHAGHDKHGCKMAAKLNHCKGKGYFDHVFKSCRCRGGA